MLAKDFAMKKDNLEIYTGNIKKLLKDRSIYWLAKQSGISQPTLGRLMSKSINPTLESIGYVADALNVTVAEILSEEMELNIPADILEALQDQSPATYEAIRGILAALKKEKSKSSAPSSAHSRSSRDTK